MQTTETTLTREQALALVAETFVEIVFDNAFDLIPPEEPEPPAPTTLDRKTLICVAGEPKHLATLSALRRTSTILTNMLATAGDAQDWHTSAACRWLLGRMTVCGLHCQAKSAKAVQTQVARIADAVLERAKIEAAAEAEALMLASQQPEETIEQWLASLDEHRTLPLDLFPDPEPDPTTPAAAPIVLDFSGYDAWEEAVEAGWLDFERNRESIVAWADWRLCDMCDWEDSDEAAAWQGRAA